MRTALKIKTIVLMSLHFFAYTQNSSEKPDLIQLNNEDFSLSLRYSDSLDSNFEKPNFDDKNWKDFTSLIHDKGKINSTIVLRSYIKIDSSLINIPLQLNIKQLGASEIYLDGKKIVTIGEVTNGKVTKYVINKNSPILITFNDTKTHVLAIRFHSFPFPKYYKLVKGVTKYIKVTLVPANTFFKEELANTSGFHKYTMLIFGFFLALAFIHFLFFILYRNAIYNLYFALYNLSISVLSYLILSSYNLENPDLVSKHIFGFYLCITVFSISLSGFVNTLFARRKLRFKVLLAIAVLSLIVYFLKFQVAFSISLFLLFFVMVESFILVIRAMFRKQKEAYIVGGGILTFLGYIAILIASSFINSGEYKLDHSLLSMVVTVSFPLSISAYLGWQFSSAQVNLRNQLLEVARLSEVNLKQEKENQQILQNQNEILEKQVSERTSELQNEKQKSDDLLLNILPYEVAEELKQNGKTNAKHYDEVSVLFTDFVNFTSISEQIGVQEMLNELNIYFTEFDRIMGKYDLEKIKTIGDAYLAVSGLPVSNALHAKNAVHAAIEILNYIEKRKSENPNALDIRIGIHSGAVIAGIVGVKKFAYDIWGDTVNTAARMEQNSQPGKLNVSEATYTLLKDDFVFEHRGKIVTKGKGELNMYFINKD